MIITLIYYKSCVPQASALELSRVISKLTRHRLHTVKAFLDRYWFYHEEDFRQHIQYPIPTQPHLCRGEMVKLDDQPWSERTIADLLKSCSKSVCKWLRPFNHPSQPSISTIHLNHPSQPSISTIHLNHPSVHNANAEETLLILRISRNT